MEPYLISPDILGRKISFLWNNDLWLTEDSDKTAVRLTHNLGIVTNSKFSPDGKYIAFRSEFGEDGSMADIYTINLGNGRIKRITYLCGRSTSRRMYTDIAGWTPSGEVVVTTDSQSPFGALTELYSVNPEGGHMKKLPYGPAIHIVFTDDGVAIGRHTIDMPHWKKYKGGQSGVIWSSEGNKEFKRIVDIKHHVSSPFYMNHRLYFITDKDGTGNIYSVNSEGGGLKRHTEFNEYYVRNAKSDGERCVFQMGGDIYLYDPLSERSNRIVPVVLASPDNVEEKFVDVSKFLGYMSSDATGDNISIVARGRAFVTPFAPGFVHEIGTSKERVKFPTRVNSSKLVYVSDRDGEDDLYVVDLLNSDTAKIQLARGIVESISVSPSGNKALVTTNRGELSLVRVGVKRKEKISVVDRSNTGIISDPTWSSDETLAAYSVPIRNVFGRGPSSIICLFSEKEKRVIEVTEHGSHDYCPSFSKDGDFLYFLSDRNLDPTPDNLVFDLSFQVTSLPMVVPLNEVSLKRLDNLPSSPANNQKEERKEKEFPLTELKERTRSLRVKVSNYEKLSACNGGVLLLEIPVEGMSRFSLFSREKRTGKLIKFNPVDQKTETVMEGVSDFVVSGDGSTVFVKDKDSCISKIRVDQPLGERAREGSSHKFDYARLKLKVTSRDEWEQMFSETKRLVRENYWNEKKMDRMHSEASKKYDAFVRRVSTRFELSDVLREFQGEFCTSHSYEIGGDLSHSNYVPVGKLGIDLDFGRGGYKVKHIFKANLTNEGEKSPSFLASEPLREGDRIVSLNFKPLNEVYSLDKLLLNRTNDIVALEVQRGEKRFISYLRTTNDDKRLRYREWVERNREEVHTRTGGKVGYVHIPDMGFSGFSEFARLYPDESKKDALIVDVRYNGGGFVSQLLLEKLTKRRIGYDVPRRGEIESYPAYSVNGPIVELVDENAGSDGDIFTHAFKLFNLGPVIGTRTWGGVVGISPRHSLVDGTIVTQPEFAFWFKDVGYGVENYGTDPTIEVQNTPDDWGKGRDSQLERGIQTALELLKDYNGRVKPPT